LIRDIRAKGKTHDLGYWVKRVVHSEPLPTQSWRNLGNAIRGWAQLLEHNYDKAADYCYAKAIDNPPRCA
jgi:hypothetical protein